MMPLGSRSLQKTLVLSLIGTACFVAPSKRHQGLAQSGSLKQLPIASPLVSSFPASDSSVCVERACASSASVLELNTWVVGALAESRFRAMDNLLGKMKISSLDWKAFISPDTLDLAPEPVAKARKLTDHGDDAANDALKYKGDHLAAYRNHAISWPPDWSLATEGLRDMCRGLSHRQAEVVFFLDRTSKTTKKHGFADINMSLGFIMGSLTKTDGDYLKDHVPTLTGNCIIYMRFSSDGEVAHKLLKGVELMQLMGWDRRMYRQCPALHAPAQGKALSSLAGNAFSAFSIGAVTLAMRVVGQIPALLLSGDSVVVCSDDDNASSSGDLSEAFASPERAQ